MGRKAGPASLLKVRNVRFNGTMRGLEPRFQAFLESAPDAIVGVNREGQIVGVNALTEESSNTNAMN